MGLTIFQLGLIITIIGVSITAYIFIDAEKTNELFVLDSTQTKSIELQLTKNDIGFFKVHTYDFTSDDRLFVQILDPGDNIITDKKIETRMAINYFEIVRDGKYAIKTTNLSKEPIYLEVEFGQTNSEKLIYPGIIIVVGISILVILAYKKLRNYNMAQPDENIS